VLQLLLSDVRSDTKDTDWALFGYEGNKIVVQATGSGGFNELKDKFKDDECQYAFVRFVTGDEESKRSKFVLLTWGGEKAPTLKRAKLSVHKASVKSVIRDFALELHCSNHEELDEHRIKALVIKAGGANYMGQSS